MRTSVGTLDVHGTYMTRQTGRVCGCVTGGREREGIWKGDRSPSVPPHAGGGLTDRAAMLVLIGAVGTRYPAAGVFCVGSTEVDVTTGEGGE